MFALDDSQFLAKAPFRLFESKSVPANEILKLGDTVVYTMIGKTSCLGNTECISNTKNWSCLYNIAFIC